MEDSRNDAIPEELLSMIAEDTGMSEEELAAAIADGEIAIQWVMGVNYVEKIMEILRNCDGRDTEDVAVEIAMLFADSLMTLGFYADPDNYFGIAIIPDTPCGEFDTDFSDADEFASYGPYNREMPGKRAREALGWVPGGNVNDF